MYDMEKQTHNAFTLLTRFMSCVQQFFFNFVYGVKFAKDGKVNDWVYFTFLTVLLDVILYSPVKILCQWVMPLFLVFICYIIAFSAVVGFAVICDGALDTYGDLCDFLPY